MKWWLESFILATLLAAHAFAAGSAPRVVYSQLLLYRTAEKTPSLIFHRCRERLHRRSSSLRSQPQSRFLPSTLRTTCFGRFRFIEIQAGRL